LIKVAKKLEFGTLYIKPAFVFVDSDGHLKLQFEADTTSALAYLYDNLCKQLGITWNYESPSNSIGVYSNCAMHAAGDRAAYGCGPDGTGNGGFCPQMTLAYSPRFLSESYAAAYMYRCNNYVDYWRSLYPNGVAVGSSQFCPSGGCLGLFLNRLDLYEVFKPDLGGAWVEYNHVFPGTHMEGWMRRSSQLLPRQMRSEALQAKAISGGVGRSWSCWANLCHACCFHGGDFVCVYFLGSGTEEAQARRELLGLLLSRS
jgi:hypothetical protein